MLKKLRIQFIVITMVIFSAMLLAVFAMLYHSTRTNLSNESLLLMKAISGEPGQPGRPADHRGDRQPPFFTVRIAPQGELLLGECRYYPQPEEAFLQEAVAAAMANKQETGLLPQYQLRYLQAHTPMGLTLVFMDASHEYTLLRSILQTSLLIGTVSFVVFLGISIGLAYWVVRPVEKAWNQQKQFVSDASHELKTPLTVIMANAELLTQDADTQSRHQYAAGILTVSRQMRTLLEQMLALARAENVQAPVSPARIDLSQILSDTLLPFEPVSFERGMTLESDIQPGIFVSGSQTQLHQVLEILLDNAQKYGAIGGRVQVVCKRQGRSHCLVYVANDGEPISDQHLQNLFKRFYRADEVRSHSGSYGLGLSIAEAVVLRHKGKIWAESSGGINTFFVRLPVC